MTCKNLQDRGNIFNEKYTNKVTDKAVIDKAIETSKFICKKTKIWCR